MPVRQPRYSKEEIARRGDEIYEFHVRSQVEAANYGRIVAIDVETGAFEVADDILSATGKPFERRPEAQPWIVRIGYRAVHHFGSMCTKQSRFGMGSGRTFLLMQPRLILRSE